MFPLLTIIHFLCEITSAEVIENTQNNCYDFIIVGAGAAGSTMVAELLKQKQYKILMIEAGESTPPTFGNIPYIGLGPFFQGYTWDYVTEKQNNACLALKDNKYFSPQGKVVGGTSQVGGMVYTRGSKCDFDEWEFLGNKRWSYKDVLKYFKKMEDYNTEINPEDKPYLGQGGPQPITLSDYVSEIAKAAIQTGINKGLPYQDPNGKSMIGIYRALGTIRNGSRCAAYEAFLEPNLHKKNFHLISRALVTKILFDSRKKAIGVVYNKNNRTYTVKASKEIIVSAGAIGSPHLLMLSGIGPKDVLKKHNIEVVHDSPGVGQNLREHSCVGGFIFAFPVTTNQIGLNPALDLTSSTFAQWDRTRKGVLTVPIQTEVILFRNSGQSSEKNPKCPDGEIVFTQSLGVQPTILPEYLGPFIPPEGCTIVKTLVINAKPKSIGYTTLKSADPYQPPIYQPNLLQNEDDVSILVELMQYTLEFMNTSPMSELKPKWHGSNISSCSQFKTGSKKHLECFVRYQTVGCHHQVGTCKMGPNSDPMAVVDSQLRVYGVNGLRVVGAPIAPTIVSTHNLAAAQMIGLKAADLVLDQWLKRNRN